MVEIENILKQQIKDLRQLQTAYCDKKIDSKRFNNILNSIREITKVATAMISIESLNVDMAKAGIMRRIWPKPE